LAQRATPSTNLNNTLDETGQTYVSTLHHLGTLLQTDAKLNWASGGGAVVDIAGKLVGITTTAGTLPGHESPAGYAIPMTRTFRRVVGDLKAGKEVEYGLLGLRLTGPDTLAESRTVTSGVLVAQTVPGGAAERAGLAADDRIVEIDGQPVTTVAGLQLTVGSLPPGRPVDVSVIRNGQRMILPVSLSKRHVAGEKVATAQRPRWRGLEVDYSTALSLNVIERAAAASTLDPLGCVVVSHVEPGSASAEAGIETGMFISHVGNTRVATPKDFFAAVGSAKDELVHLRLTNSGDGANSTETKVE
jgi:S1-C subfamily serine protease